MAIVKRPLRRSALLGPWGVGAIVPFPRDESLMIAGLDMWRYTSPADFEIEDVRLKRRLNVKELRWPPDYREKSADPKNFNIKIPAVRFPNWYYCPFCGTMMKTNLYSRHPVCDCYQWENGRKCNPKQKYKRRLIPERFVVVCPKGHISDFPVEKWVHDGSGKEYIEDSCRIRRSTGGTSASLTGVVYECSCGAKKSLVGVTRPGALKHIDYNCPGGRPWLGEIEGQCDVGSGDLRVLLRGATNLWFANTVSSIYIPTDDDVENKKIAGIVKDYFVAWNSNRVDGELNFQVIQFLANANKVNEDKLKRAFITKSENQDGVEEISGAISEDEYRANEYDVLIKDSGGDEFDFHSKNYSISEYNPVIHQYFSSISLVPKLRETRAFVGFSRLEPPHAPIQEMKETIQIEDQGWLPAIEILGEGIFFEFNKESVENWKKEKQVQERVKRLDNTFRNSIFGRRIETHINAEYVLIHTFAHLIINQLSYECGYGSSSLRERIYCEKTGNDFDMLGVLIYTASGDSDGSLGGLVRQGEPGRIEDVIVNTIKNALWCTSDPICIQSLGQGPESCNLAACHNCALLPETCCEHGNRLLDRGLLIGTLVNEKAGYFDGMRELQWENI